MAITALSTLSLARQTRGAIATMQAEQQVLQQEISTGRKHDVAGQVGSRTAGLLDLRNVRQDIAAYKDALQSQAARLTTMQDALGQVRTAATKVRDLALGVSGSGTGAAAATIDEAARDALKTVTSMLNASQSGRFLFAGTRFDQRPVQPAEEVAPSGLSPNQAVAQVLAAFGPVTSAADVDALIDGPNGLASLFNDGYDPDGDGVPDPGSFTGTFFQGSTQRVVSRAEADVPITYAVTAGDQPVRDLLMGLHLMSAIPNDSVPTDAYKRVAERGWQMVTSAMDRIVETQGILGLEEETVARTGDRLDIQSTLISTQIVRLEEADPYQTSLRLNTLQTQLEATFAITAKVGRLSLVDYL